MRIEAGDRLFERGAVDIGDDRGLVAPLVAPERVDQQLRAQSRAADADMEDVADRTERFRLDRVDEGAHAGMAGGRPGDAPRRALPALGAVLGGAALGGIDALAREHRIAPRGEAGFGGKVEKGGEIVAAQMGLGEIEQDAALLERQPREAIRLGGEQVGERPMRRGFEAGPGAVGHVGGVSRDAEPGCIVPAASPAPRPSHGLKPAEAPPAAPPGPPRVAAFRS